MPTDHTQDPRVVTQNHTSLASRFQPLRQVETYWHAIRNGHLVPRRSDIDPRGIEGALDYAFVAERVAPGAARLRVAGAHLSDLLGMEVRGMSMSALFDSTARIPISDTLEEVFSAPAIAHLSLRADPGPERPGLQGRMILMPLKSDLGDISRLLGCLVMTGDIGRAPRRFGITHVRRVRLLGDTFQEPPKTKVETRFAEDPAPFAAAPGASARPYLRLVHSDEGP